MLDSKTKKQINNLRDILVGKIPDPKSQVEQITIALFYKFMWDRDKEIKDLGGNSTFFVGEFEKYSWENLFAPGLGGLECLKLYSEAIEEMEKNPNIPSVFRDIFKRAFLPYNDPYTLKLFLKGVNDFHYSNSEKLGDGFEYLLSILGTQGNAGQFRTPRHIIDFITEIVDPNKDDRICDPACGTAGFLISAYKHIQKTQSNKILGDLLTPEDKKRLGNNLFGLDIDPMMVKLALANLYLNGLNEPNIFEYDSLTSEDRWHEEFDVILANPPFMTPKGGIKPHNKFSINAKKAEILFVDYCIQHLRGPKKLGIIIPEGILHNNYNSYKEIRKRLIQDNLLFCEVELHHGVFKPYADVKTHILFCDYHVSKKSNSILFVNIKNDGFSITGARKKINDNDIDFAKDLIKCFKENKHINPSAFEGLEYKVIQKKDILNEKVFSLIGRRYLINDIAKKSNFPSISLKDKIQIFKGKSGAQSTKPGKYKFVVSGEKFKSSEEFHFDFKAVCIPIVSSTGHGHASVRRLHYVEGKFALADIMCCIKVNDENLIHPKFLFIILNSQKDRMIASLMTGTSNVSLNLSDLEYIEIPFPSYEIQLNIVEEYETHSRRIFDLEKEVIERKIIQDSCGLKVWGD